MPTRFDVIIPVFYPDEKKFKKLLRAIGSQTQKPGRLILMHTDSDHVQLASLVRIACRGAAWPGQIRTEIHELNKDEFDHGATRNFGVSLSDADYVVFMTQDAVPADEDMFEELLKPFGDAEVAVSETPVLVF